MKVLYLHQHFSTPQGATGTRSYEMARHLLTRGHAVTMICGSNRLAQTGLQNQPIRRGMRRGFVDGIEVVEIYLPYKNADGFLKRVSIFLKFAWKSTRLALSEPYDLVFATSTPLTIAIPGILAKILRRKPFVFEVRDLWPELPRAMGVIRSPILLKLMSWLESAAYTFSDAQIGLAPGIVEGIQLKNHGKPVAAIPNGCDLELFRPLTLQEREKFPQCSDQDFIAIFTGTHGRANGLWHVMKAAAWLKKNSSASIKFVFVGDGQQKPKLIAYAQQQHLDNCLFLGPQPKSTLARLTASADVGLQVLENIPAFYRGTSPNKFFDYLAAGIPILNNYPGWLAELIQQHDCGKAIPPERPDLFGQTLLEMQAHPERCRAQGKNGRKLAESTFQRALLAQRFALFLEETYARTSTR